MQQVIIRHGELPKISCRGRPRGSGKNCAFIDRIKNDEYAMGFTKNQKDSIIATAKRLRKQGRDIHVSARFMPEIKLYAIKVKKPE